DAIADLHFAPTEQARANLLREDADPARVVLTGNTAIDALLQVVKQLRSDETLRHRVSARFPFLDDDRRMILVTGHRRENFGEKFTSFCRALRRIATQRPDIRIVYAVHFNPNVQQPVRSILNNLANVSLIEPQEYLPFVYLMMRAYLISGIDDLFIDICYLARVLYKRLFVAPRYPALREQALRARPEQPIAVMIPAWQESSVIRQMLLNTRSRLDYTNYVIFVGTYPNDPATAHEVDGLEEVGARVIRVTVPHPGPTNKADCLNWIYHAIRRYEAVEGIAF